MHALVYHWSPHPENPGVPVELFPLIMVKLDNSHSSNHHWRVEMQRKRNTFADLRSLAADNALWVRLINSSLAPAQTEKLLLWENHEIFQSNM